MSLAALKQVLRWLRAKSECHRRDKNRQLKANFMHFWHSWNNVRMIFFVLQDAYAEPGQDSRNIAGIDVVIIVEDVQDVAPVFTLAPPVTRLPSGLIPGDKVTRPHSIHLRPLSTTFSFLADSPSSRWGRRQRRSARNPIRLSLRRKSIYFLFWYQRHDR